MRRGSTWFPQFTHNQHCECHKATVSSASWTNKGMWKTSEEATHIIAYNRPFPLKHNGMQNTWRHTWGASESLLGQILHCYIWEHGLRSDSCYFVYREEYRAALTLIKSSSIGLFNSVDRIPSDFVWHWTERSGTGGLLSASRAVELVKTSKMYIYMYYLLVTT